MLIGLVCKVAKQVVTLLLRLGGAGGPGAGVRFVDDDQSRALFDEHRAAVVRLNVVDADDLVGIVVVNARVSLDHPVQSRLGVGADDDGLDAEFGAEFLLPLVAEMRQADHDEARYSGALHHFTQDQKGLHGLADADVVGDQQADGVLSQGHHQRYDLVGTGAEGELGQGPERPGPVAEG